MTTSLRTSAASGIAWTALQMWTVRLTTAGAFVILSRQLQPKEFGLVALASAVIAVLSVVGDSGISVYVQRVKSINQKILSTAFWTTLAMTAALSGAVALLAGSVATLFREPDLTPVLQVLSIGLFLNGLNGLPSALLMRDMRFKALAVRGTVATFIGSAVAITMALSGYGVWALVAQSLVRSSISLVIIWISTRWIPSLAWSRARAVEMISFGSQMLGISLMMTARDRGEDFLFAGLNGTGVLGLWSVANRLVRMIQETGSTVVSSVATPAFAKMQGDSARLFRAYEMSLVATGSVMFPAFLLLFVISPDLVPTLLGQQWQETANVARVIALTSAVGVFVYFDRSIFVALDRLRPEMAMVASIVVTHLVIVALVSPIGLMPLALALLARSVITWPIRLVVLHRVTGMPYGTVVRPLRVLAAAIVMAGAVQLTLVIIGDVSPWIRIGVSVAVATVIYPSVLLLTARSVVHQLLDDLKRVRGSKVLPVATTKAMQDVEVGR